MSFSYIELPFLSNKEWFFSIFFELSIKYGFVVFISLYISGKNSEVKKQSSIMFYC